jgi:hypothetical protein
MAILQIIYLAINVVGIIAGLIYFVSSAECVLFSNIFTFVHKYFKNVGLAIITILFILLLLPTLTVMSAIITFTAVFGGYADFNSED